MKLNVFVQNQGQITLNDSHYVAAGGEASIYKIGKTAFKIYHNKSKMIPLKKIEELNRIQVSNVLKPKNVIQEKTHPVGYTMDFVSNTHPICKLFTKSFKDANGLKPDDIMKVVKQIQLTIQQIHKDNCLIVDLNELNLLISSNFKNVYFIDVDSYQSPSFRATAIMESIKDRLVKHNQWSQYSDWFSFAVLSFQLYVGIHPYKGNHPSYKMSEWSKRMDDFISVFDKKVSLPKVCNDFSVIPDNHLKWMKNVFTKNERSIPPLPDEVLIIVTPVIQKRISGDLKDFDINLIYEYTNKIKSVFNISGVRYVVTNDKIYKEEKEIQNQIDNQKIIICDSGDATKPVICKYDGTDLKFTELNGKSLGSGHSSGIMSKNGCVYSIYDGKLNEFSFRDFGGKILLTVKQVCNVSELSTKVFDGVIFQDLLGKIHITFPYEQGKCLFVSTPELNGFRILEAKSEKNICIVLAEQKGIYYRFVMQFNDKFTQYTIRRSDNVSYSSINFTLKSNGVCILAYSNELEIFHGNQVKVISNSPIEDDMKLFELNGEVCFIDENKIYSVKMK